MLSITGGHAVSYLLGGVAGGRERYYLDATTDGEPPGRWQGEGAALLGLDGDVQPEVMERVYGAFRDPRDAEFASDAPEVRPALLGSGPRNYRTPDDVVAEYVRAHPDAAPEEVAARRVQAERNRRAATMFEDATLGIPKSVTVLHAALEKQALTLAAEGRDAEAARWNALRVAVEDAIDEANAEGLAYLADRAGYARVGGDRSGRATQYVKADQWVVGSFFQHTNRDLEPHLHVHNAILNRAPISGTDLWRALDGVGLRAWKQAAGAVMERTLQERLTERLGLSWQLNEAGHTREVVGIEAEVLALFSGRTAKVTAKATELAAAMEERLGRPLTPLEHNRLRQQATLATRRAKDHTPEALGDMLDRWHEQLRKELAGGLTRVAARFEDAAPKPRERVEFSPAGVIAEALHAVQAGQATWTRPQLIRRLDLALPDSLGGLPARDVIALLEGLADQAIASADVLQTAGTGPAATLPAELRRDDGTSVYEVERNRRYTTTAHVIAEEALRRAAVDRSRLAASPDRVDRWLRAHQGLLGADQAAAVRGIATSRAGIVAVVGPAGAGKSHLTGALTAAWEDATGGRVIGLAVTQVATEVLRDDGVTDAANTTAWLHLQAGLAAGTGSQDDEAWRLTVRDIVLVDEASMLNTAQMGEIREAVDAAGARMVLAGDPAQLGSVGAGGMMALLASGEAETYSLSDVRRFEARWERAASLRLRDGDEAAVREYDRHGRLLDGGTLDEALDVAARGYVLDRLAGRRSVVVTDTNADAAELAGRVREHLVKAGVVEVDGVPLGRDGNVAGVGDVVACRRIDWQLGVLNRRQYEVTGTREDGGLTVVAVDQGTVHTLPAGYVGEHVTLGYAATVHGAQGQTVDTGWTVLTDASQRPSVYVGMTRGRDRNTAVVVTRPDAVLDVDAGVARIRSEEAEARTPAAVLADILDRVPEAGSAAAQQDTEREWVTSAATIGARFEDAVRVAGRVRTDQALDRLVEDGVLSETARARLGADAGTEYLSRVLRAVEQAGHDPDAVLRDALAERDFAGVRSVAQTLSARVTRGTDLTPAGAAPIPAGLTGEMSEYLRELRALDADRTVALGEAAAHDAPGWAVATFGPVPDDEQDRARWVQQAGVIAAHRERSGWDSDDAVLGPAPGVQATEQRAAWHEAWDVLGRPEAQAEEGDLTEGALRVRVASWRREEAAGPAYVDDYLRATSIEELDQDQAATIADVEGRGGAAAGHEERAGDAREGVEALDEAARVRGAWFVATAAHREAAVRAAAELGARGVTVDAEPDRTSVEEYVLRLRDGADGPEWVQETTPARPDAAVPAAEVVTVAEAAAIAGQAAWVEEILRDRASHDDTYLAAGEWEAVEAESRAWEDADGTETVETLRPDEDWPDEHGEEVGR